MDHGSVQKYSSDVGLKNLRHLDKNEWVNFRVVDPVSLRTFEIRVRQKRSGGPIEVMTQGSRPLISPRAGNVFEIGVSE